MAQLGVGECGMTGTQDSDYREQIARALVPGGDQSTFGRVLDVIAPLVEQLRRARAAYNRMAGHAVDRAAERDRYYLAWQSAARGRRQARQQWQTWQREAEQWQAETVESAKANEGLRAELAAVGRAIECFLGVEYGTPVESARALVERCADAESALDGLRATAVVLPEDWRGQITRALVAWGQAATVRTLGTADTGGPCWDCRGTGHPHDGPCDEPAAAAPVEAETPARPIDMVYLLDQYDRLLSAVEHIRMDTPGDRDRHARVIATFRRAAEPVREQVEGAAPPEVEITDEHVREHDDAAPNRDKVVEAWADTWDGVDRTSEWVRVVEPCPVPDCTIPQVHGHEGYGLRFTPAAKPAPQGEPDEDWCGRFADDGKHYCPEGHNTVYQMFSGGREWYCADCGTQGTYPPAPADVGPRARLLTQPGGAAELKRQMDEHLASPGAGTEAGE